MKPGFRVLLAFVVGVALAVALVFWGVPALGHALGLTPSPGEAGNKPDGWVGRHYEGVVGGYVLTVALIAVVAILLWLAALSRSASAERKAVARRRLPFVGAVGAIVLVAALVLPIGERSKVLGNVPNVVGMSASAADARLNDANLQETFAEMPTDNDRCRVYSQTPRAGAVLDEPGPVALRCHMRVPRVVGEKGDAAKTRIQDAGVLAIYANEPAGKNVEGCTVAGQSRSGDVPPNAEIRLRLEC